jgi:N-acylglucosamine-6-phosphate 2-epimerase
MMRPEIEKLRGGLIVSCQSPPGSPLDDPLIIAALALTAEQNGAVGVRINSAAHVAATRARVAVPIIGIEKLVIPESEVYITPTFDVAGRLVESGAAIVATDATRRARPGGERLEDLIRRIRQELQRPVMADVATLDEGLYAADCGAEIIATTLCGYTADSRGAALPALELVEQLAARLDVPVVCEGGVASPEHARQAFDCGAFAVVVGTAITGVGKLVESFVAANRASPNMLWPRSCRSLPIVVASLLSSGLRMIARQWGFEYDAARLNEPHPSL